jgi:predicted phosphodiesterase
MRIKKQYNSALSFPRTVVPFFDSPGTEGPSLYKHTPSWKFVVVGDTHGGNRGTHNKSCINDVVVRAITNDIVKENPDFVLVTGDLVNGWFRNGGTDYAVQYANWKDAMKSVYEAKIRVYPIRGNHDSGPERLALPPLPTRYEPSPDTPVLLKKAFVDTFSEDYIPKNGPVEEKGLTYSFVHKNTFIIGLDQFTGGGHRVNQMWLNRQLAENGSIHVFVFGHEPAFDANHRDNLAFYPKRRDVFWNRHWKGRCKNVFLRPRTSLQPHHDTGQQR